MSETYCSLSNTHCHHSLMRIWSSTTQQPQTNRCSNHQVDRPPFTTNRPPLLTNYQALNPLSSWTEWQMTHVFLDQATYPPSASQALHPSSSSPNARLEPTVSRGDIVDQWGSLSRSFICNCNSVQCEINKILKHLKLSEICLLNRNKIAMPGTRR
jgi:hypothetical protein